MKKELQLKYILEDFIKNHPITAPVVKVVIDLADYSYVINHGLN